MKKIIVALTIMAATFCNAETNNNFVFTNMPPEYRGCSIGIMSDGIIIAKIKSIDTPIETKIISWEEWKKTWDEWNKLLDDYTESEKDGKKEKSDLYQCAENDFVYPADVVDTYESRQKVAQDLTNARMSDIRQVTKKIGGEMRVYFEICGSGYSLAERHAIEKEIQEAIQKILDSHFDK